MRGFPKKLLGAAGAVAIAAAPGAGQTLFMWPDTAVDVSKYTTVEECAAAIGRVHRIVTAQQLQATGAWRDTMPFDPAERMQPRPLQVTETARRCMQRFAAADTMPIEAYRFLVPLYLSAGWDDRARTLVDRRLAVTKPNDDAALLAVIDTIANLYSVVAEPPRHDLLWEILWEQAARVSDRVTRFKVLARLLRWTTDLPEADLLREQQTVLRVVALFDSLTVRERARFLEDASSPFPPHSNVDVLRERLHALLEAEYGKEVLLDSLRRSTAAFGRLKRMTWARATGLPPDSYREPIGMRAPALEGEIWLGCGTQCGTRPTLGRVALVVFVSHGDCVGAVTSPGDVASQGNCARALIPLRRLQEQFPQLEITIAARTRGFFGYLKEGITEQQEAELTRRWLDSFGLERAVLIMSSTPYWRLPAPDSRRIESSTANQDAYSFGGTWPVTDRLAFLIDQDGMIVRSLPMARENARELAELIEILLERERAGT